MSDSGNSNMMLNPKTKNFPDGSMTNLRTELSVIAGFVGAFVVAFFIWCVLFKYFSDKEDQKTAALMARGTEMRGGARQQGNGIVKTTETVVQDFELNRQAVEETGSGSKDD